MQQAGPPPRIQIGLAHKKSSFMNDEVQLTKEGGCHKINAIKVYSNEKYILGFVMYYKLQDGDYLKAGHNVPKEKKLLKKSNKIQSRVFEIGPDDYLLEIAGHFCDKEKHFTRLTFTSYRGKIGNYGSDNGTPFKFKFQNYTFGPFASGYRDYIDFLDIPVLPAPVSFLNELKPITVNVNISDNQHRDKSVTYRSANPSLVGGNNNNNNGGGQQNASTTGGYSGVYVSQNQNSNPTFGSVKMPSFNIPTKPVQQQQPPQQYQAPPQQYQAPPQQYQAPQQPQKQQSNNSSNVTQSKYPDF